jgi:hypothetical protein
MPLKGLFSVFHKGIPASVNALHKSIGNCDSRFVISANDVNMSRCCLFVVFTIYILHVAFSVLPHTKYFSKINGLLYTFRNKNGHRVKGHDATFL